MFSGIKQLCGCWGSTFFTVSGEFPLVCSCGCVCVYLAIWVYLYGSVWGVLMVRCVEVGGVVAVQGYLSVGSSGYGMGFIGHRVALIGWDGVAWLSDVEGLEVR
ncbi:hypothetical protein ADT28_03865 [Xylella fastidiosa]|nr:hypothetical protein OY18_05105 [Xylella fastidiosa]ETE31264.1 hypothetical protein B398_08175 [Xylella fastidiosa 32]OCA57977.1 hypothetical protein AA93_05590 [Xylella fastidiosa subsp. pauca 11399]OJZ70853.1 hypothetical protein B375_0207505 [Xylella fastidiosa 6c]ALR09112.2 hypothetical protein XFFB_07800 [Xylella fastidiosa]